LSDQRFNYLELLILEVHQTSQVIPNLFGMTFPILRSYEHKKIEVSTGI